MIKTIKLLRQKYHFCGYIHAKAIPGANEGLLKQLGKLVDRLSANIELPTDTSLKLLAPNKKPDKVDKLMGYIKHNCNSNFVPTGQSTQMIIGATPDTDLDIMNKSENLYNKFNLKRVFYSAYVPINKDKLLPAITTPPLKRENRLYQADWLIRFYGFKTKDILNKDKPNFNLLIDPKANWAINHLDEFPKEINTCNYNELLKIPGIGIKSAKEIIKSRKFFQLTFKDLKKMGVVLKRAQYFITCGGKYNLNKEFFKKDFILSNLIIEETTSQGLKKQQLSLFS